MTTMTTMTTTTEAPAGFLLPCPCCGDSHARISLNFGGIEDPEAFTCHECDATFSVEDVRRMLARWQRVLAWVETVPTFDE